MRVSCIALVNNAVVNNAVVQPGLICLEEQNSWDRLGSAASGDNLLDVP